MQVQGTVLITLQLTVDCELACHTSETFEWSSTCLEDDLWSKPSKCNCKASSQDNTVKLFVLPTNLLHHKRVRLNATHGNRCAWRALS